MILLKGLRPFCNVTRSSVLVAVGVLYLPLHFIIIVIVVVIIVLLRLLLLLISFLLFQLLLEFLSRAVYCSYEVNIYIHTYIHTLITHKNMKTTSFIIKMALCALGHMKYGYTLLEPMNQT